VLYVNRSRLSFQLQDLRRVIARMLAINTSSNTAPDCEIISRLEKLILATQASSSTSPGMMMMPVDDIVDQLSDEFRSGYRNAGHVLSVSDAPQPHGLAKPKPGRPRSGNRRLDSKVY